MKTLRRLGASSLRKAAVLGGVLTLSVYAPKRLSAQSYQMGPAARTAGTFAITNATIIPVVGERIARGTVVMQAGRITAVGASAAVPAGATVIDGNGLFVYPGLIDAGTVLGISEIGQGAPGGQDITEIGDFNPHNRALVAVNPFSEIIPTVRVNGVTTAITAPRGGQVSGQASLIDLFGWTPDEMGVLPSAAMIMTYPRTGGGGGFGGGGGGGGQQTAEQQRERVARESRALREFLGNAKAYSDVKQRTGDSAMRHIDIPMEAMVPVMRGQTPVIFDVETADQIRGVLTLADSFNLRVIIRGGTYSWQLADTLAARRIPVILGPLTQTPAASDPYDMVYATPGVLARAGVMIAFRTNDAADSRNLPYNAALATAYGLDPGEALRALTINAARMFGVQDRLGSIEVGKQANLIVTTGDPLDVRTNVRHVFIRGQQVPFNDRHTRLYEAFRARPRPEGQPARP